MFSIAKRTVHFSILLIYFNLALLSSSITTTITTITITTITTITMTGSTSIISDVAGVI